MNQGRLGKILYDMYHYGIAIYGAGKRGERAFGCLQRNGYKVKYVIDRENGKKIQGVGSIKLSDFREKSNCVCIVTPNFSIEEFNSVKVEVEKIFKTCLDMRFIEWLEFSLPEYDEVMNYKAARPFRYYESPFSNRMEYEYAKKWNNNVPEHVELNIDKQLSFMQKVGIYARDFNEQYDERTFRYRRNNGMFADGDGLLYHSMIRHYQPNHIIEIGSGHSTAMALDTMEFWECNVKITCIEPYSDRLKSVLKDGDEDRLEIIEDFVQHVALDEFDVLQKNDILFIDSSHVLKSGGDLVVEFLQILPRLKSGVIIHIHDIVYPFQYYPEWISKGLPYGEAFLLHAFLIDNPNYEILFWEDYIGKHHKDEYENYRGKIPDLGSSFWMRKI